MKKLRPPKGDDLYRQLWRAVDGAVLDAFKCHPDYVSPDRRLAARMSIVKRVVGSVRSLPLMRQGPSQKG